MSTTVQVSIDRKEFIGNIVGSSFWVYSWWTEVRYDEGFDWDTYPEDNDTPFLTLSIIDPDDDDEERTLTKKVSVNDIATAFVKSECRSYDDIDAPQGDSILQYVFFDEYTYC